MKYTLALLISSPAGDVYRSSKSCVDNLSKLDVSRAPVFIFSWICELRLGLDVASL